MCRVCPIAAAEALDGAERVEEAAWAVDVVEGSGGPPKDAGSRNGCCPVKRSTCTASQHATVSVSSMLCREKERIRGERGGRGREGVREKREKE